MAKQESVSDWMELAKIHDKLEKETIRPYVMICIQDGDTNKTLYKYDIPRQSFFEHNWIIRWRMSRIQCQYPRRRIIEVLSFYDKITGIDWVIVGGESGTQARPMRKEWVLNIQRQCKEQGVPFFFKQWGTWGEDGVKRNKKANGCMLDGVVYQEFPKAWEGGR